MEEEDIMDEIIYTTNTGSTERYARLLSHETGLPAYSAAEGGEVCLRGRTAYHHRCCCSTHCENAAGTRGLVLCDVRRRCNEDRDDGTCENIYEIRQMNNYPRCLCWTAGIAYLYR